VTGRNTLSREAYRIALAGLENESAECENVEEFRSEAITLAIAMASLFSQELDRVTLWDRIASGLDQAARENANDGEAIVNSALRHVLASPAAAARHEPLSWMMDRVVTRDAMWSRLWARWIVSHMHSVIVHARTIWNENKESKK